MTQKVVLVDTDSGNLRSVERALEAASAEVRRSSDPQVIRDADRIVVPGQGSFATCTGGLDRYHLRAALHDFIATERPFFGICLGLQLLFASSEESPGERGLGELAGEVKLFPRRVGCVPHMGWNQVQHEGVDPLLAQIPSGTDFYFTHSYYAQPHEPSVVAMWCTYGDFRFAAAVRKGHLFACQFHPEKSQGAGLALLSAFVKS